MDNKEYVDALLDCVEQAKEFDSMEDELLRQYEAVLVKNRKRIVNDFAIIAVMWLCAFAGIAIAFLNDFDYADSFYRFIGFGLALSLPFYMFSVSLVWLPVKRLQRRINAFASRSWIPCLKRLQAIGMMDETIFYRNSYLRISMDINTYITHNLQTRMKSWNKITREYTGTIKSKNKYISTNDNLIEMLKGTRLVNIKDATDRIMKDYGDYSNKLNYTDSAQAAQRHNPC
jgi:hypothetical protein